MFGMCYRTLSWGPQDAWSSGPQLAPCNSLGSSLDPLSHPVSAITFLEGRYLILVPRQLSVTN